MQKEQTNDKRIASAQAFLDSYDNGGPKYNVPIYRISIEDNIKLQDGAEVQIQKYFVDHDEDFLYKNVEKDQYSTLIERIILLKSVLNSCLQDKKPSPPSFKQKITKLFSKALPSFMTKTKPTQERMIDDVKQEKTQNRKGQEQSEHKLKKND